MSALGTKVEIKLRNKMYNTYLPITSIKKGKILKDHNKDFCKTENLSFGTLTVLNYNEYLDLNVYKCTTGTINNNNLCIQLFSPGRSHLTSSFFTKSTLLILKMHHEGDFLIELLNYEIMMSLPL